MGISNWICEIEAGKPVKFVRTWFDVLIFQGWYPFGSRPAPPGEEVSDEGDERERQKAEKSNEAFVSQKHNGWPQELRSAAQANK